MSAGRALPADREIQEQLVRLEAYRNQLAAMVNQLQYLASSRVEHRRARETLEALERADGTDEALVPIGADAFVRATPRSDTKVLLGIGSGVVVEMDRPKASELVAQRTSRLDAASQELEGQVATLEERIEQLSRRLDRLSAAAESGDAAGDVGRN